MFPYPYQETCLEGRTVLTYMYLFGDFFVVNLSESLDKIFYLETYRFYSLNHFVETSCARESWQFAIQYWAVPSLQCFFITDILVLYRSLLKWALVLYTEMWKKYFLSFKSVQKALP